MVYFYFIVVVFITINLTMRNVDRKQIGRTRFLTRAFALLNAVLIIMTVIATIQVSLEYFK
jgi:hypothetical protein